MVRYQILLFSLIVIASPVQALTTKQLERAETHRKYGQKALAAKKHKEACEEFHLALHYLPEDQNLKQKVRSCEKTFLTESRTGRTHTEKLSAKDRNFIAWLLRTISDGFKQI